MISIKCLLETYLKDILDLQKGIQSKVIVDQKLIEIVFFL